ncbi:MAG: uracil-DNA glycosylase [Bacteroidetes bacterium]|nr:uracil-DNA glycosylase [Bacteroidota bacterium]MDE2671531.1 uracil-DNA glycosylase [Bacteroidota bacterium]
MRRDYSISMVELFQGLKDCLFAEAEMHGPLVPVEPLKGFAKRILDLIPKENPVRALSSLEDLRQYVENVTLIPIDAARTNAVFGEGNPRARIMLVGEAPGADEDRLGRPFVGRAGKLLDKMIAAIGLLREELFIANILKSRPPGNRNPEPQEIAAHLPVLYKQMALIQPEFILCLGKVSGQTLLNSKGTLGSLRGKIHDYHGIPLLVTYHPAALLRNQRWKRPAWEDLQRLQKLYTPGIAPQ